MEERNMSAKPKITGIRLNIWGWLVLIGILLFFCQELLMIGLILGGAWLIYRHREKILRFLRNLSGK